MKRIVSTLLVIVSFFVIIPAHASDRAWFLGNATTVDLGTDLLLLNDAQARANSFLKSFTPASLLPRTKGLVYVGGVPVDFAKYGAEPLYFKDRTMVPLRALAEAYGATVDWNPLTYVVTIRHWTNSVQLRVGDNRLFVDGNEIVMDVNSFLYKDRTYVPLRAVGDFLGAQIFWDPLTNDITLTNDWRETTILAKTPDETKTIEIHIQPIEIH